MKAEGFHMNRIQLEGFQEGVPLPLQVHARRGPTTHWAAVHLHLDASKDEMPVSSIN